jgi:uncharacterized protein
MNECNYIIKACAVGDMEYVKRYLSEGENPNSIYDLDWTPLNTAVENDQMGIIELLLKNGADINFQSAEGWTALHQAVDLSIDSTIQNSGKQGEEPTEIIKYLLDNGASVSIKDKSGMTPLDLARIYNSHKIIEFLINYKHND